MMVPAEDRLHSFVWRMFFVGEPATTSPEHAVRAREPGFRPNVINSTQQGDFNMSKFLTILAAGSALALVSVAAPTNADARCRGCGIAAGVVGGIAAGAIIAGAASNGYYGGYDYAPGYAYGPSYGYAPGYAYDTPYGYYGYGGSACDRRNYSYDRQLHGSC
jgi:hypothetical protein